MGVIASGQFGELLDPGLRKIFMDEYGQVEGVMDQFYGMEKSNKATEYDYSVGGIGDLEEFGGTIPYTDFEGQYKISYSHREWVQGMKVERKLVDDDLYNIINKRPASLALSARRTREKHGATIFNNAFTTGVFAGGDGKALCASDHTWVGTSDTQSNTGTSALSAASLASARLAMRNFNDETGTLLTAKGSILLVPPELEQTAYEITQTPQTPYDANNTLNFIKSQNFKVIVWDYLSDTNNWFLIDAKYAKLFLKWFDRIPTEFNKDKDFDTYISKWSVYTRYSYGFSSWSWIYGSNVA